MTFTDPATDAAAAIRGSGLRMTVSRRAVYEALRDHPHASAEALFLDVVPRHPRASRQSVYNALGDFVAAGLVRRIEPAGSSMLFELRVGDNHHHVVCDTCGAVQDVDCAHGSAPCLTPVDDHGFVVHTAEVTYWGTCPDCAATPSDFSSDLTTLTEGSR